jgi:hypothetical protein
LDNELEKMDFEHNFARVVLWGNEKMLVGYFAEAAHRLCSQQIFDVQQASLHV